MELHLEWYDSDGFSGSDDVDGCDGVVVPSGAGIKVAQVKASNETEKSLGTNLRTMTAPRDVDGSRCLRHIAGPRTEGFSQKIGEDRAEELIAVRN